MIIPKWLQISLPILVSILIGLTGWGLITLNSIHNDQVIIKAKLEDLHTQQQRFDDLFNDENNHYLDHEKRIYVLELNNKP